MATPVINPNTSVLGFTTGQFAAYQCATTDGQTGTWSCANLPDGLSINTTSGLISGMPTTPGVYNTTIKFTNANGTSALAATFGIDDAGYVTDVGIEVNIDLISGAVTFPTSPDGKLHGKNGDYLPLLVGLQKSGELLDLPVTGIAFGLKEFESDARLILSNGSFTKLGSYERTRWRTLVYLDPAKLEGALSDYEASAAVGDATSTTTTDDSQLITLLSAPCEIQVDLQQTDPNLSPSTIQRSSQIFTMLLERAINS
ncbi:MAG: Ig domain-containing protein [Chthoniobacteraceae bacterium]